MKTALSALTELSNLGDFCCEQFIPSDCLSLSIKGFSSTNYQLKLPLSEHAAKSLAKLSKPAKFGWKDQTLLDTNIRDCGEIAKSNIKINNRLWNKAIKPVLTQFKIQLGLPEDAQLTAHLHNLLIYKPKQFFARHQDSEKLENMVASLIVILPSAFTGGALIVEHQGEAKCFPASRAVTNNLNLIAFYADCQHEVKPINTGYRVTLTFNLVLNNSNLYPARTARTDIQNKLNTSLKKYFFPEPIPFSTAPDFLTQKNDNHDKKQANTKSPSKFIYLLDHQYTQNSLSWNRLKGDDQIRVDTLRNVAKELQLEYGLAQADVHEIWDCEQEHDSWNYNRYATSRYEEDDYQDDENYLLHELIDWDIGFKHGFDENKKPVDYQGLKVCHSEICWTKATNELDPFESEYEGYMGNYGNTMDKWYHRAAIILYRKQDRLALLCEADPENALVRLLDLSKESKNIAEAKMVLIDILPVLKSNLPRDITPTFATLIFKLACQIDDEHISTSLLANLSLVDLTSQTAKIFLKLEESHGESWSLDILQYWSNNPHNNYNSSSQLIEKFSQIIIILTNKARVATNMTRWLLNHQFDSLKQSNKDQLEHLSYVALDRNEKNRTQLISEILRANDYINNKKQIDEIFNYIKKNRILYPTLVTAEIVNWLFNQSLETELSENFNDLLLLSKLRLEQKVNKGGRAKDDWSIKRSFSCQCEDCIKLNIFLQSKETIELRWPLKKSRRSHIHTQIEKISVPVTHQTERKGSPYILVLIKKNILFTQDEQYVKNLKISLGKIKKINC